MSYGFIQHLQVLTRNFTRVPQARFSYLTAWVQLHVMLFALSITMFSDPLPLECLGQIDALDYVGTVAVNHLYISLDILSSEVDCITSESSSASSLRQLTRSASLAEDFEECFIFNRLTIKSRHSQYDKGEAAM